MARRDLSEGRSALAKLDFVAAIAKYKEAAAHGTDRRATVFLFLRQIITMLNIEHLPRQARDKHKGGDLTKRDDHRVFAARSSVLRSRGRSPQRRARRRRWRRRSSPKARRSCKTRRRVVVYKRSSAPPSLPLSLCVCLLLLLSFLVKEETMIYQGRLGTNTTQQNSTRTDDDGCVSHHSGLRPSLSSKTA
jgi:hypothetical protein